MIYEIYQAALAYIHDVSSTLSGGDAMAKGLVTVAILGAIVAIFRKTPTKIKNILIRRFTVTLRVEYEWYGSTMVLYNALGKFIAENQTAKNYMVRMNNSTTGLYSPKDILRAPNYSSGLFFYKGRPFFYTSEPSKEKGSIPAAITLTSLGRSMEAVLETINIKKCLEIDADSRYYHIPVKEEWQKTSAMMKTSAIFLPAAIKKQIDDKLDFFMNNEDWYYSRGISRKLLIIVHGPAGTGKSRIARYVADYLNRPLGSMSSPTYFSERMRNAAAKNIVVSIPDFDALAIGKKRVDKNNNEPKDTLEEIAETNRDLDLAEVLNLFQGDIPVHDLVVVMSTNCINTVDEALLRRGRCDLLLEIGPLGYDEANSFLLHHFQERTEPLPVDMADLVIKACDLMAALEDHSFDVDGFINELYQFVPNHNE